MEEYQRDNFFASMPEEEIVRVAQTGDKQAQEYLLKKNLDIVYSRSRLFFIRGLDREDVIQEGRVGLFKAIRDYCGTRGTSFRGFAHLCVNRQLISAIKMANRKKHLPLNSSTSIDKSFNYTNTDGDPGRNLLDILADETSDPEQEFLAREMVGFIIEELKKALSPLEWDVFSAYLQSKSYEEISQEMGVEVKTVDNALQRTRRKIEALRQFLES